MTYKIEIDSAEVPRPGGASHADFLRRAAWNINAGHPIGGSNVTKAVVDLLSVVADAMDAQKPRMDEPGWGEKVIAHTKNDPTRREFVRYSRKGLHRWIDGSDLGPHCWDNLLDPEPIEGGESR